MAQLSNKIAMQGDVFEGISAVFAKAGGFSDSADLSGAQEFPVSEESGFSFDTGEPTIEHFKVKGLSADWATIFKPGDGEINIEIPCHNANIISMCFGTTDGSGVSATQKAVTLGIAVLNDTEDKLLIIPSAKFMARLSFDGTNKPLCVLLKGAIMSGNSSIAVKSYSAGNGGE